MNNEVIFFTHVACVILTVGIGMRGKVPFLGILFCLFLWISNLFVIKEIECFGIVITTCDAYTVGSILCLNLIQEFKGKQESRKWLYRGLAGLGIFVIMSRFQNLYQGADHSLEIENAFKTTLQYCTRIVTASFVVTFLMDRLDMVIFNFLKSKWPLTDFSCRFLGSTLISQLLDTILFTFIGLGGIIISPWSCILTAYIVKMSTILLMGTLFFLAKKWIYNPLKSNI